MKVAAVLLRQRDMRERAFPGMSEIAWTMLLILADAEARKHKLHVSNLCGGCHAPYTTALRHLALLERKGLVEKSPDPFDGRSIFVRLTVLAREKIDALSSALPVAA